MQIIPFQRSSVNNRSLTPLHEQHEARPPSKLSNKSASPLPDYDDIMRTRYGLANKSDRAATLPPMYESERDSANDGTLGRKARLTHGVLPLSGEMFAITDASGQSSASDDKSRERKRSAPASVYDSNGSRQINRMLNKSPYVPSGRTSPMKGVNTLPMHRLTPQHDFTRYKFHNFNELKYYISATIFV